MTSERLCIHMLTYNRPDYAQATLRAVLANLKHDGPLGLHISDDGSPEEQTAALLEIAGNAPRNLEFVSVSNAERGGMGKSYNLGCQTVHEWAEYVLMLEDDWVLRRELDTAPILKMLSIGGKQSREEWQWAVPAPSDFWAQSVRLGYLGFQWPLTGHMFKTDEHLWMALDPASPEQHVQTGHPRIETVAYQRRVGPWPEGLNPGATELGWCQTPAARDGIVWPLTIVSLTGSISGDMFDHIGAERSY